MTLTTAPPEAWVEACTVVQTAEQALSVSWRVTCRLLELGPQPMLSDGTAQRPSVTIHTEVLSVREHPPTGTAPTPDGTPVASLRGLLLVNPPGDPTQLWQAIYGGTLRYDPSVLAGFSIDSTVQLEPVR